MKKMDTPLHAIVRRLTGQRLADYLAEKIIRQEELEKLIATYVTPVTQQGDTSYETPCSDLEKRGIFDAFTRRNAVIMIQMPAPNLLNQFSLKTLIRRCGRQKCCGTAVKGNPPGSSPSMSYLAGYEIIEQLCCRELVSILIRTDAEVSC